MIDPEFADAAELTSTYGSLRGPIIRNPVALEVLLDVETEALRDAIDQADPADTRLKRARALLDRTLQGAPRDAAKRYQLAMALNLTRQRLS